jgi:hypothetical protein
MYAGKECWYNCPSVVSSQIPTRTFGDTGLNPVEVKGVTYLVGEEAQRHAGSIEDTRRIGFVCSPGWFALLGNSLRAAQFVPFLNAVAIGLPPGELGPAREEMIRNEIRQTPILFPATGEAYSMEKTRIFMVPQGAGIYFSYMLANRDAQATGWP